MVITDYHVQSVLRAYNKQLKRLQLSNGEGLARQPSQMPAEKLILSDESRRKLIMERMTSQVLERAYRKPEGSSRDEKWTESLAIADA